MLNVVDTQDKIIEYIASKLPIPLIEQAFPDASTVRKVAGKIEPYAAIQPGMPQTRVNGKGFAGVRSDDYTFPFQIQVVAADPVMARKLACGSLFSVALGFSTDWTGEMDQKPGGQLWPIVTSNGATEAYQFSTSWGITVQLHET